MAPDQNRHDGVQGKLVDRIDRRSRTLSPRPTVLVVRLAARLAPRQRLRAPNEASRSAREAERRTSLSGDFARDKGELRFNEDRFGEVSRITFQIPAATPIRKNTIRNAGLVWSARSRTQPIPEPTITAETNSLPARKPSDIAEPAGLGLGSGFCSGAGADSGPAFQFARQPVEPRPQAGGLIVGVFAVRTHGAKPSLEQSRALLSLLRRGAQIALSTIERASAVSAA